MTNPGNNFARTCSLGRNGGVQCNCQRGYTGARCESCEEGYAGEPMRPGGSCEPVPIVSRCDSSGTAQTHPDGRCICKENVVGERCDQCASASFYLNDRSETGCVECFCMGVSTQCTSSSWYRNSVGAAFTGARGNEFTVTTNYEADENIPMDIRHSNDGVSFHLSSSGDTNVYYWRLPVVFSGNKITSYGGNINYTVRYVPMPGGSMSRNNAADVVIKSLNDLTILHFRSDESASRGSQSYQVPITEDQWQRPDGNRINRQHLLMALADVSAIYIKATYTTTTEEAALSHVSLDTASEQYSGLSQRAVEVEQCQCPTGHQGLSCEDCLPGYTRTQGLYLELCSPCECNGHSDECDPETGVCIVSGITISYFYFNSNIIIFVINRIVGTTRTAITVNNVNPVFRVMLRVTVAKKDPKNKSVVQIAILMVTYLAIVINVNAR